MRKYMKIFWTQNQNPNEPSTLIIDGAMDQYKGLPEQEEAMAKLNELKEWGCDPAVTEDRGEGKKFNPWFNMAIKAGEGIVIRSCFNTKDDAGNMIPYIFFSSNLSTESAIEDLKQYSSMLNRSLDTDEISMAVDEIRKYPKKQLITILLIMAALATVGLVYVNL